MSDTLKTACMESNNTVSTDDNLFVVRVHLFGSVCADIQNDNISCFSLSVFRLLSFILIHEDLFSKKVSFSFSFMSRT